MILFYLCAFLGVFCAYVCLVYPLSIYLYYRIIKKKKLSFKKVLELSNFQKGGCANVEFGRKNA